MQKSQGPHMKPMTTDNKILLIILNIITIIKLNHGNNIITIKTKQHVLFHKKKIFDCLIL